MKTRLSLVFFFLSAFFAFFAVNDVLPAHADGLVVVDCPPIVVPLGTPVPRPLPPFPIEATAIAPSIKTPLPPRTIVPPMPPIRRDCSTYLTVKNHNVTVTIDNQVARTRVDETFTNDSAYALEGTYIFPLPEQATISNFAMWVDGKRLEAQVLDKNQARQIYEDIVRTRRDPALLEYVGRNAFRARIFPIPPRTEKKVELEYSQVVQADRGLVRYVYPLNTEKFSPEPIRNVSINVSVQSNAALKAIYSPSHSVSLSRDGDYRARVGYEDSNVKPDRDFVLYYSVTPDDIGMNLLMFKSGGEDGFFLMLVAPRVEVSSRQVIDKDVVLVLDVSGSMQGAKIEQAKRALSYVLDQLGSRDRFNVISFSTGTNAFASSLQPASRREDARDFVSRLRAEGSTDINRALLEALGNADRERPTIVIFLTDGLPTTGETSTQKIITNATNAAPKNVRLFTFGVGDDVNTILLDSLAEKLRGASGYIRPSEKIDEIVSSFYAQVSTPVLADISIDWAGASVSDVYPYPLPDLFAGTQLVVAGRYRGGGAGAITLKGNVNGVSQSFRYSDVAWRGTGGDDSIPRLWATRKIGHLINQIRLQGESREAVNEIVTIAVRYGIVTPYTSFLVDERQDVLTQSGRNDAAKQVQATAAPAAISGPRAVQQSQEQSQLRSANVAPAAPTSVAAPRSSMQVASAPLQYVGDKTFISRNSIWTDTQYDPSKMTTKKIEFGSDAYLTLAANNPEWGKYIGLGSRVIFVVNGTAYEITDGGTGATDPSAAPTALPTPESRGAPTSFQPPTFPDVSNPVVASSGFNVALISALGTIGLGLIAIVGAVIFLVAKNRL